MGNTNSTEGNNPVSSYNQQRQHLQQQQQQHLQQQQRRRSRSNSSTFIPTSSQQPSPSTSIDKRIKVEKSPEPIPVVNNSSSSHPHHPWSPTEPSIQEDLLSTATDSRMEPKQIPIIMKDNEPLSSSSTTNDTPPKAVPVSTGKKSGWVSSTGAASPWYGSLSSSTSSTSHHRASISGPYYRTRGMSVTRDNENDEDLSSIISNTSSTLTATQAPKPNTTTSSNSQGVPTIITWTQGGNNVFVTGTFNGWKHKIKLIKSTHDFNTVLELPPGTHRLKFIVDDEWKCSNELETATDPDGNLVNYLQVMDEEEDEDDDNNGENDDFGEVSTVSSSGSLHNHGNEDGKKYSNVIPPELLQLAASVNHAAAAATEEEEGQRKSILSDWEKKQPQPPTLPPHLEKVLLNSNTVSEEDNSVLYEPNHVTLNHLYACSIKDNVMALATTSRYRKKYVTTMYYRPVFPKN